MTDSEKEGRLIFVPCVKWVKRGVAQAKPEQIKLTEEELAKLLQEERAKGDHMDEDDSESSDNDDGDGLKDSKSSGRRHNEATDNGDASGIEKYNFDDYDDEDATPNPVSGLAGLTVYPSNKHDPDVTVKDSDDEDSEQEDDEIKPTDSLVLVGKVTGDEAVLEVYVYNDNGETFYVHHDILLPDIPLCIEWLNYDPSSPKDGNMCAVGGMSPVIQVLDLDLIDSLEPAYILGEPMAPKNPVSVHFKTKNKLGKKKAHKQEGHTDAVLDLSWNTNFTHVLASGSVDETVLLWDLENGSVHTKLTAFKKKIQSLQWHPFEGQTLLTGCSDKFAKVFDCRSTDSFKAWELPGEIERVTWDHYNPFCFLASTDTGHVYYVDCRNEKPLWDLAAHNKETTGLCFSSQCPGMLITSSSEGNLKVWDLADSTKPSCVWESELKIGSVQCLDVCPDLPFLIAAGGDKKSRHFLVQDVSAFTPVERTFSTRELVIPVKVEREADETAFSVPSTSGAGGSTTETTERIEDDAESSESDDGPGASAEIDEPQPGPSNGLPAVDSMHSAMSKLKLSRPGQIRKPKLPPRAKIIQKRKTKSSKKSEIFSKRS